MISLMVAERGTSLAVLVVEIAEMLKDRRGAMGQLITRWSLLAQYRQRPSRRRRSFSASERGPRGREVASTSMGTGPENEAEVLVTGTNGNKVRRAGGTTAATVGRLTLRGA